MTNNFSIPTPVRKVKNGCYLSLLQLAQRGIVKYQQFKKVPIGGLSGKLTFRTGLNSVC